jgi:hypothetical protein
MILSVILCRERALNLITIFSQSLSSLSGFITSNQLSLFFEPFVLCRDKHDLLKAQSLLLDAPMNTIWFLHALKH